MPPRPPASAAPPAPAARLRVLVVITRGEAGGAQVHVADLVGALHDEVDFTVALGESGFLTERLGALGVPVRLLPVLQREIAPREDLRALGSVRALVREVAPHLVHTHSTKAGLLGRLAARLEGVPAVHTAHAWSFSDGIAARRKAFAVPLEAAAGRVTERFIVVSEADREVGVRWRVARPAQVRVVHNGVADVPERAVPDAGDPPRLVMVARFAAPKDHVLLLRALARVGAPWALDLVGDGPDRPAAEAEADRLGLRGRVAFHGARRDVPALLAGAQVGVLVSRQEGFPLVVLEAMRAGLPVVASDVGGIREAVEPERTGLLVPRGDGDALVAALARLLGDPALRRRWGEAGRAAYEARFTVERMVAGTLDVYRELAQAHGWPLPAARGAA